MQRTSSIVLFVCIGRIAFGENRDTDAGAIKVPRPWHESEYGESSKQGGGGRRRVRVAVGNASGEVVRKNSNWSATGGRLLRSLGKET